MLIITDTPSSYNDPETRLYAGSVTVILPASGKRERHITITPEGISETFFTKNGDEDGEWSSTHDEILSDDEDDEPS